MLFRSLDAINECKEKDTTGCIILSTVKGQGIKYFEDMMSNHHVKLIGESINEMTKAIEELEAKIELMKGKSQ